MRKIFFDLLFKEMEYNSNIILLTADMGYGLLDTIKNTYPNRFFNFGSSEQLMIGAASGMSMEGKIPVCYSITSFLLYYPFAFIRHFMNNENLPIKLVGGGRNKDYGYLGSTHWAEDDIDIMCALPNIRLYKPNLEELNSLFPDFINSKFPSYINLSK